MWVVLVLNSAVWVVLVLTSVVWVVLASNSDSRWEIVFSLLSNSVCSLNRDYVTGVTIRPTCDRHRGARA